MAKPCCNTGLQFPTPQKNNPSWKPAAPYHILRQVNLFQGMYACTPIRISCSRQARAGKYVHQISGAYGLPGTPGHGAVPAKSMSLSVFNGLLSNINVADNIVRGESYFFNEVQRIKGTIQKINDGRRWLILIDELFKGTNVQDAMKCSSLVIEGLLKMPTHCSYCPPPLRDRRCAQGSPQYPVQLFFETSAENGQLHFSYHLKEGISNDRSVTLS